MNYASLNSLINDNQNAALKTVSAAKAYQEYCDNYLSHILEFTDGEGDDHTISLMLDGVDELVDGNSQRLVYIGREQYEQALADEDALVDVYTNEALDTIKVTGNVILDAVEHAVGEIKLQSLFLKQVIDKGITNSVDFITSARSICQGVTGDLLEKYGDLIDSSDSINSIINFFSQAKSTLIRKVEDVQHDDVYIELVNPADYQSVNVWLIAFTEVGNTIASFFNVVWEGIFKIGNFIRGIVNGIVSLVKWIGSKMFSQLYTNYDKGEAKIGYMDYPILQKHIFNVKFDLMTQDITLESNIGELERFAASISTPNGNDVHDFTGLYFSSWGSRTVLKYSSDKAKQRDRLLVAEQILLDQLCYVDGAKLQAKQIEVVLPCSSAGIKAPAMGLYPNDLCDILIRIGLIQPEYSVDAITGNDVATYQVWMQCFIMDNSDNWCQFTDNQNLARVNVAVNMLIKTISKFQYSTVGVGDHSSNYNSFDQTNEWNYLEKIMTANLPQNPERTDLNNITDNIDTYIASHSPTDPGPVNLTSYLPLVDTPDYSLFEWMMGPEYVGYKNNNDSDIIEALLNMGMLYIGIISYAALVAGRNFQYNENFADNDGFIIPAYTEEYNRFSFVQFNIPQHNVRYDDVLPVLWYGIWNLGTIASYYRLDWPSVDTIDGDALDIEMYPYPVNYDEYHPIVIQAVNTINSTFKPFNSYDPYKVTIHYQTTREQINEAKIIIWTALIAIIAITTITIIHKYRLKRERKAKTAQGRFENYCWNWPDNPTKEDVKQYNKLRKTAKRESKLNSLLGIASPWDDANNNAKLTEGLSNQVLSLCGLTPEKDNKACDLPTVVTLIRGN